jgi:protein-S-isoprenylcysteine O-methyltransferase Ste14
LFFVGYAVVFLGLQWGMSCQKSQSNKTRAGWFFGSLCLAGGMLLATLYALRFQFPLEWINIPNLKYWHGTLNTLGFGWCSLWAWEYVLHSDQPL